MPRKRRQPKRRPALPQGVSEISLCERSFWNVYGPTVHPNFIEGAIDPDLHHVWPSWDTWAEFYAAIRDELHVARPWRREISAAERLYQAWLAGRDCAVVHGDIAEEVRANDPRRFMFGGARAS